ncbi:MAG: rhomboid family intramembrane serine protease [Dehalococcoidia bacterium]|nr:rhomboid family intramembrane serine protease [Dehalococcoidia bacterium]
MFPRPPDSEDSPNSTRLLPPGLDRTPYVTWLLLGANVIVYLLTELMGGSTAAEVLIRLGAMESWLIASGEYWRLFSAMFLHSGLIHLGFNIIGLLIFGQQLERLYGYSRFLVIYILAGLAGSITSYVFNLSATPNAIGVGASGAVFGILGALVAFFLSNRGLLGKMGRQTLIGLLALAAINLAVGFAMPGIDNFAHIGGFVGGFLLGMAFSPNYRVNYSLVGWPESLRDMNSMYRRLWVLPVAIITLIAGVVIGNSLVGDTPLSFLKDAREHHEQGDFGLALNAVELALEIQPYYGPAYLRRALILTDIGSFDRAMEDLGRAVRLGLSDSDRSRALDLLLELRANR